MGNNRSPVARGKSGQGILEPRGKKRGNDIIENVNWQPAKIITGVVQDSASKRYSGETRLAEG